MCRFVSLRLDLRKKWITFRKILTRGKPTDAHAQAWVTFERVMATRSQVSILLMFMQATFWDIAGISVSALSPKYVESDDFDGNRELAQALHPYASTMFRILNYCRPVLCAASIYKPQLTKYFYQYLLLGYISKELMPMNYGT